MSLIERIKSRAAELGFDLVGIVPVGVARHAKEYAAWVAAGFAGEMAYMTRDPERRSDLDRVLPNARSIIVIGLSYYTVDLPDAIKQDPSRGLIARYAWGVDYHSLIAPRLEELARFVKEETGRDAMIRPDQRATQPEAGTWREQNEVESNDTHSSSMPPGGSAQNALTRVYVDTGPVLERDWALAAGLGFIGKNTCLINPRMGSWLFLGVVITDAALIPDPSPNKGEGRHVPSLPLGEGQGESRIGCGTCTRCLTACPTKAFPTPYVLDARKCISYLTIELKGSIPLELRPLLGNHIFGCDICQDVCPWPTRFATPTKERAFFPIDIDRAAPKLIELARLSEADFKQRFTGTPLLRTKRRGLLRNVAVALGNWGSADAREALAMLAREDDPIISEHARWGLTRC